MEEINAIIVGAIIGIIGVLLFTGLITFSIYINHKINIENFENTINELTEEQKCLHICGFRFNSISYFDQYKFCVEKCDRISERAANNCN